MNGQPAYDLILAVAAIGVVAAAYAASASGGIPAAGSVAGLTLGIGGFLLMLSTETLYSLRKRLPKFHFGPMRTWLQVHVFTGLVGPFLVLLHTGWRFNGLAGILMLVVGVVVFSGLVGRYIYTAVPRHLDGAEMTVLEIEDRIALLDARLRQGGLDEIAESLASDLPRKGWMFLLARPFLRRRQTGRIRRALRSLPVAHRAEASELERLLTERQRLLGELRSLAATRRILAFWHVLHVPLGAAMFGLAFVHIWAALHYSIFSM